MKYINAIILLFVLVFSSQLTAQNRYLEEVFDNVTVTQDVQYATNITVITVPVTGAPSPQNLVMDIYQPAGDEATQRPVIIMFHTGNFLPFPENGGTGGTYRDSTVVGIARRLAKMGYVVGSATYRAGWNPVAPEQSTRVETLINAAYRGVQDARTAARFVRKTVEADGNPYGIDPNRVTLFGIGTGGYVSMNATALDSYEKTLIEKFIGQTPEGNPIPMVLRPLSGDPFGLEQAPLNLPNHTEYSSDIQLCVNLGGAMGDTSWLTPGLPPMISFHVPTDPFAPYKQGTVIVPVLNLPVVEVQGSYLVQQKANLLGNNNVFVQANFGDEFTAAANKFNDGYEGLYPFTRPANPLDSSPWDWWDPSNVNHQQGLITNPDMSFEKAMIFADTILGYFAPRAYAALDLEELVSSREFSLDQTEIRVFPNPANNSAFVSTVSLEPIREIIVRDMNGRIVNAFRNIDNQYFNIPRDGKPAGMYILECRTDEGVGIKKLLFN
jgi:hypothetical protein